MPQAREEGKPRGRMSAYAYFVQTCREEHKKKHPNESVVFKDFTKKCADRWRTMSDKEKGRFHDMAKKDKVRYDSQMKDYVPVGGSGGKVGRGGKKTRAKKDPNAPKRSLSAFFWFCADERPNVRKANPEFGVGDVAKELGRQWSELTPGEKVRFEKLAEKDKARYEMDMTAYKKGIKPAAKVAKAPSAPVPIDDDDDEEEEEEEDEDDEEDDE